MKFKSRFRNWINRDDGRLYQADNKELSWHEVVGYLLLVFSAGLYGIPVFAHTELRKYAIVFLATAVILFIIGAFVDAREGNGDRS